MTAVGSPSPLFSAAILLLYGASGMVALTYEVLWMRMLGLQFGISNFGVVITVSAFMIGLGAGSMLGRRLQYRVARPLRLLGLIELGIGLYALLLPPIMDQWNTLMASHSAEIGLALWYRYEALAAMVFLLLPATAMGIGFPLVLSAIKATTLTVARVYGVNTLGAALGALLPLALLPAFGWVNSIHISAGVGIVVGLACVALGSLMPTLAPFNGPDDHTPQRLPRVDMLAYAVIGAAALILQVAWARLYGMVLLRTEYVVAVLIAVFLAGVGLGSVLAHAAERQRWLNLMPLLSALCALVSLAALAPLSAWAESSLYSSLANVLTKQGGMLALVTFPVTLCLGAWLPLLTKGHADAAAAGASLYGANAVGAGLGALLAGFVLMPWLGSPATVMVAAALLWIAGMRWSGWRASWLGVPLLLLIAIIYPSLPPVSDLLPQTHAASRETLYLHEDAIAITHVVATDDGQRLLLSDLQRMDASTEPTAVIAQQNQARLPLLLLPSAQNILFLGLGTGISASAALDFDTDITAVELSRGAIESAQTWFTPLNQNVTEAASVIHDDARRYLMRSEARYDVIVGDLFHPDMVGRSRLLSVQQFSRARSRLNEGGIFVQWLALNQFDLEALRIILNSFHQSFPEAVLFVDGFRLAMVGRKGKPVTAEALLMHAASAGARLDRQTGGEGVWTWLGRYFGSLPSGALLEDEWRPRIEYHLPRVRYNGSIDLQAIIRWLLQGRPAAQQAAHALRIPAGEGEAFERAYLSADAAMRSWLAQLNGDGERAQRFLQFAYAGNPRDQWVSGTLADHMLAALPAGRDIDAKRQLLQRILAVKSDHPATLEALWRLESAAGNDTLAADLRARLQQLSPLYRLSPPSLTAAGD